MSVTSSCAHVGRPTLLVEVGLEAPTDGGAGPGGDHRIQLTGVDDTGNAQRAPESAPTLRQRKTNRIAVQVRSPTRSAAGRVRHDAGMASDVLDGDYPQQLGGWRALPATDTGALRGNPEHRPVSRECATYH